MTERARQKEYIRKLDHQWHVELNKLFKLKESCATETREEEKIRLEARIDESEKRLHVIDSQIDQAEAKFNRKFPGAVLARVHWIQTTSPLWNEYLDLLTAVKLLHHEFQNLEISLVAPLHQNGRELYNLSKFTSPAVFKQVLEEREAEFFSAWKLYFVFYNKNMHKGDICSAQIIDHHHYVGIIDWLEKVAREPVKPKIKAIRAGFISVLSQLEEYCELNGTLEELLGNPIDKNKNPKLTSPPELQTIWDSIERLSNTVDWIVALADKLILQCIELLSHK